MFFVDQDDVDAFFLLVTGSENPYWAIASDSDALRLGGSPECSDIACKLNAIDVAQIRSLADEAQEVPCSLSFYGKQFNVFLIGRRTSDNSWQGVASARSVRDGEYAVG
jgi:cyclic di-GMP phosphodiesterase Gmr